ncbi:hypothetical protein NS277_13435 [Novosphingobium barchaimii]|nr:hypothetical protein NS277_13435 [Novosphingobium barchaimii]
MIYERRALQRRLNELRGVIDGELVDALAKRLNRAGKDRVAAMWETVVLHALSKCGTLENEVALASGRRPDIKLITPDQQITADVTAVSDEGLDNDNPYQELGELVRRAKDKLGLPIGGLDIRIRSRHEKTQRGTRTVLLLPPRGKLQSFVHETIVPQLRRQIEAGEKVLRVEMDDEDVGIDITINPLKTPYDSYSFAAYDVPKIKDRNPLYGALKAKANQLRGADGITGVIVGDGDCTALSGRSGSWDEVTADQIIDEFFRQFSSVDFVLLLSTRETEQGSWAALPPVRKNSCRLRVRQGSPATAQLDALFRSMMEHLPKPGRSPVNGALRAREDDYDLGHHGGYSMSRSKIRIGLREFTEILAGLRTLEDNGAKYVEAARKLSQRPNDMQGYILRNLMEGRLPSSVEVIKTGEDDNDDWVEIQFGDVDPAIAPLK